MKYSFLFPYKNRHGQFFNTLLSLLHWYGARTDWDAIVILDGNDQAVTVPNNDARVKVFNVERDGVNPAPLFNLAGRIATGDYLVITNPECYHASDVLGWFDSVFAKDPTGYAVAACDAVRFPGQVATYSDRLGEKYSTYQHSTEHNVWYHFCSAMSRARWKQLGGFDERFGAGYACEDDDFRDRIVCAGIPIYTDDSVKVLHQQHDKYKPTPEIHARYQHNLKLLRAGEAARGYKHDVGKFKKH